MVPSNRIPQRGKSQLSSFRYPFLKKRRVLPNTNPSSRHFFGRMPRLLKQYFTLYCCAWKLLSSGPPSCSFFNRLAGPEVIISLCLRTDIAFLPLFAPERVVMAISGAAHELSLCPFNNLWRCAVLSSSLMSLSVVLNWLWVQKIKQILKKNYKPVLIFKSEEDTTQFDLNDNIYWIIACAYRLSTQIK